MKNRARGESVLIIDDIPKNLQVLGTILSDEGYRVIIVDSGSEALETVERALPDLILLDVMMPGLDGFEVCKRLKESPKTQDIPVIFLTVKGEVEDIVQGFEYGAMDYITKPFHAEELLIRVKTQLQLKSHRETILRQKDELKELLHVLCHDLINPLTGIISCINNARAKPSRMETFSTDEYQDVLLANATRGVEMINLVRKLRELEEGKMQLSIAPVNLKKAVLSSLSVLDHQFKQKEICPVCSIPDSLYVLAEETSLINTVLNNLLTNAIKFSYRGSDVTIDAKFEGDNRALIIIRDFGIGIPGSLLPQVFDTNMPTTRPGTNQEMGTGFGLPLVKRFIESYGGSITIDSTIEMEPISQYGTEVRIVLNTSDH